MGLNLNIHLVSMPNSAASKSEKSHIKKPTRHVAAQYAKIQVPGYEVYLSLHQNTLAVLPSSCPIEAAKIQCAEPC